MARQLRAVVLSPIMPEESNPKPPARQFVYTDLKCSEPGCNQVIDYADPPKDGMVNVTCKAGHPKPDPTNHRACPAMI